MCPGKRLPILFAFLLPLLIFYLHQPPILPTAPCEPLKPLSRLQDLAEVWRQSEQICGEIGASLRTLYQVEQEEAGRLVLPKPLQDLVQQWVGRDLEVQQDVTSQRVLQVTDLLTSESTHYNQLRARRPRPEGGSGGKSWVVRMVERTKSQCHFCQPQNFTAEELWGRIFLPHCSSAGNVFRVAGASGLILAKTHSVLEINLKVLSEMLKCCQLWFDKTHDQDNRLLFPSLIWDTLPKAGASQAHPHFQVWLSRSTYPGHFGSLLRKANLHSTTTGRDYWKDVAELHISLGLGLRHGSTVAIAPLTSIGDHEVMVIGSGENVDESLVEVVQAVFEVYRQFDLFCHSMGMAMPPLQPLPARLSLPILVRMVARGPCDSAQSDVSSFELFAFASVSSDPLQTITTLRTLLASRR